VVWVREGPLLAGRKKRTAYNAQRLTCGAYRARSPCRVVLLILFIPESPTYSVSLFLKRRCDRTLGEYQMSKLDLVVPVVPEKLGPSIAARVKWPLVKVRKTPSWPKSWANCSLL
jgi:hypothetical protein